MIKVIGIGVFGIASFLGGYFYCKHQLGDIIYDAVETLGKTKLVMVKADDLMKGLKNEIDNSTRAEDEKEQPKNRI